VVRRRQLALRRDGPAFTLLKFDSTVDVARWRPWPQQGMPLKVIDTEWPNTGIFYGCGLVLLRPISIWPARPTVSAALRTRFARTAIDRVSIDA
jgi:hypothetical protein